ncbi:hypothetical protein SAMN06265379_11210 [Saccharicrinis carchari]|uniref:D-glucuronyl C5-epimerase C-terminus n=1 Tax=Saccharicrinis carchari TaxID=1168039 RepID=A0A521EY39_SACCC|nr:hypothetical protein [Saccharicrinis carchari]SMO88839.1 hypothetical protein SAMN06265379_11210 [Saccharicrinis carchari]
MKRNISYISTFLVLLLLLVSCDQKQPIEQLQIDRVETMPFLPQPYKMLDWKEVAVNFDRYVFDYNIKGDYLPFIWLDDSQRNFPQQTFGLYTAIGDVRQGSDANGGEFHEAVGALGALMSAGLVGIDKTDQQGYNYVKMSQNYFNLDNEWNIFMNNTSEKVGNLGGGYSRDWWYDVFPNMLYYAVADLFPGVDRSDSLMQIVADQFYSADSTLNGDYSYSFFDYSTMEGKKSHIPFQEDAAAGHAWVLMAAYQKFGDEKYLQGAKSATEALLAQKESRFYEVLMPFGALTAARLNAQHGTSYNFHPILDWTFDGTHASDGRYGWGIINERWGSYDVHGIQGSWDDGGGFGFLMNSFDMAWPLVPMVRYAPEYAETIGKWMLNVANATRLFYPNEIPDNNQTLPNKKNLTRNVIAYEGLRKNDKFDNTLLVDASPVALGDGPLWAENNPDVSQFSIYGSAHVGIFGAIVQKTNVDFILKLDCLATDFHRDSAYPTYLIFNPYDKAMEVDYFYQGEPIYLFDVVSHRVLAKNITGKTPLSIPAQSARLIVEIPEGLKLEKQNGAYKAGDVVVSYK